MRGCHRMKVARTLLVSAFGLVAPGKFRMCWEQ